jgi:hypothetical protein
MFENGIEERIQKRKEKDKLLRNNSNNNVIKNFEKS